MAVLSHQGVRAEITLTGRVNAVLELDLEWDGMLTPKVAMWTVANGRYRSNPGAAGGVFRGCEILEAPVS